jgi:peptide deformylase
MRTATLFSSLLALVSLQCCKIKDYSLSLDVSHDELTIVQQLPSNSQGRSSSPLYTPPRVIGEKEFKTPELNILIDSMYQVMLRKSGVGIAANQIGKRLQIFIIEAKADNPRYKVLGPVEKQIFINPVITKVSETRKNFWHGCLSAQGEKRGNVATYEWLEYTCRDAMGNIKSGRLEGFAAVIFQHEFKHLMNGTYLDVAKEYSTKEELDKGIALGKIPFFEPVSDSLPLLISGYKIGQTLDEYHQRK